MGGKQQWKNDGCLQLLANKHNYTLGVKRIWSDDWASTEGSIARAEKKITLRFQWHVSCWNEENDCLYPALKSWRVYGGE